MLSSSTQVRLSAQKELLLDWIKLFEKILSWFLKGKDFCTISWRSNKLVEI